MAMITAGDVENMGPDAAREVLAVLLQSMPQSDVVATIRECIVHQHKREDFATLITDPDVDC